MTGLLTTLDGPIRPEDPTRRAPVDTVADTLRDPLSEDGESVQLRGAAEQKAVKQLARQGTEGSAGSLPFLDKLQDAFGPHDVSGVKAFTDEPAKAATQAMGAAAYAKGDSVVLGEGARDLHTVAHEAAHIVQQRHGLKPPGGVGSPGDPLEQQADEVADEVVQGRSAMPILDKMAGR